MRHLLITFLLVLIAAPAAAQTSDAELRQLAQRAAEAVDNPGNQADRDAAARALRQAIRALEQNQAVEERAVARGRGHQRHHGNDLHVERCIDIGVAAYNKAFDERYALDQAVKKCQRGLDANLLEIAFAAESKAYDDRVAFERAVEFSQRPELHGKIGLLKLAFDAYNRAYDDRAALDMAAKWAASVRRRDESCIRRAHAIHARSYDARAALDMAVKTCTQ